jgi:hypothetical protein
VPIENHNTPQYARSFILLSLCLEKALEYLPLVQAKLYRYTPRNAAESPGEPYLIAEVVINALLND